eukprot:780246-Pyramimonas_sp.AAC.1
MAGPPSLTFSRISAGARAAPLPCCHGVHEPRRVKHGPHRIGEDDAGGGGGPLRRTENRLEMKELHRRSATIGAARDYSEVPPADEGMHIRATNGHSRPGLAGLESLYRQVATLTDATHFVHGAETFHIPSITVKGLSCQAEKNPPRNRRGKQEQGRQFIRGCPHLPGDHRVQSGFRKNAEIVAFIS